ncbi:Stealth CR1 domain-containing protein [Weissella cibaria]|uniref:Stealth CR1 domain-containing protein n=1 Tax=Weissella cibaria TaxID=137591 RepID=UPI00106E42C7|nr:Stealth CR1 domain-containing protein [Weissella cibaria]MBZ5941748.1 Stealth CR1 domain-containing protein [Weissella cibaria]MCB5827285.1 Stealth CR1 domain-containing protein [Weissella cibaria]MCB5858866.1 Stealth CR1 domain-containing protein [Weissella cibaria]MCB5861075.1 Stealth CR1 domain-containing protein [Weissella cibaria]MCB5863402.1 Stealth CR1 domain-containing protein [Weissella cibaria]
MQKIDFVLTWVDDSDPAWIAEKNKYDVKQTLPSVRVRDWDFLIYWFRSVEKYAPWVNKIHLVTWGHVPTFLNINHDKVNIVNHSEIFDEQYLPIFSTTALELSLHKIPGITENFVYFNDDMFINKDVTPEDFFVDGKPKDIGLMSPILPVKEGVAHIVLNDLQIINNHFNRSDYLKHAGKFFNWRNGVNNLRSMILLPWNRIMGFYDQHLPLPLVKSRYEEIWSRFPDEMTQTIAGRFRSNSDYSVWLIRYWQLLTGDFVPRSLNFGKYYQIQDDLTSIVEEITKHKHALIVLNDNERLQNFENTKRELIDVFASQLTEKSAFEL